jgi:hypothetical protein
MGSRLRAKTATMGMRSMETAAVRLAPLSRGITAPWQTLRAFAASVAVQWLTASRAPSADQLPNAPRAPRGTVLRVALAQSPRATQRPWVPAATECWRERSPATTATASPPTGAAVTVRLRPASRAPRVHRSATSSPSRPPSPRSPRTPRRTASRLPFSCTPPTSSPTPPSIGLPWPHSRAVPPWP